jgi:hypothetical protein
MSGIDMIMNNKGFSLLMTLILSSVALAFISTLIYFVQSGTKSTASLESYKSSLEVAKGASEFLIAGVYDKQLGCEDNLTDAISLISPYDNETASHNITIIEYHCKSFNGGINELYSFRIRVQKANSDEVSEVEFGYLETYED